MKYYVGIIARWINVDIDGCKYKRITHDTYNSPTKLNIIGQHFTFSQIGGLNFYEFYFFDIIQESRTIALIDYRCLNNLYTILTAVCI